VALRIKQGIIKPFIEKCMQMVPLPEQG